MRFLITAMLLFTICTSTFAQKSNGIIQGRILDKMGKPVAFANVVASNSTIDAPSGIMSTSEGYFVIPDLPPGTYSVKVSHISYEDITIDGIVVVGGETTSLETLRLQLKIYESVQPIVVTGSRNEQPLDRAPVAMTVIDAEQISQIPADDYGDLLRGVPGVNVAQNSAGDFSISSRRATGAIPSGQLTLIDGRPVYFEFNGSVWWNTFPVHPSEIKQIEVLRGPGSAIWGANAVDGVVNIITKSPKEMQGTTVIAGGGEFDTWHTSVTHAGAAGKWGYKLSGTYYEQKKPFERPTGMIPGTDGVTNPGGTPYPDYPNEGTKQPKVNVRLDYDQDEKTTWSLTGGYAGFQNMILTPSGPAVTDENDFSAFGQVRWKRGSMQVTAYGSAVDGSGQFLMIPGRSDIESQTYGIDAKDSRLIGDRNLLTYGATARLSTFDMTFAPEAEDRRELGAFLQDRIEITRWMDVVAGARIDNIDPMGTAISPRASLLFSPFLGNTIRLSYNRAFRAPTTLEQFIYTEGANVIVIDGPTGPMPLVFPFTGNGNRDADEERLDSYEVGWVGRFGGRLEASLAVYYNELDNKTAYAVVDVYSSSNPPPGWPLDPALLDIPAPNGFGGLPSRFQLVNLGKVKNTGMEAAISVRATTALSFHLNYSYQDEPEGEGIPLVARPNREMILPLNRSPKHRFNALTSWEVPRYYANIGAVYQDEAFWADVFDARYWGPTESFVAVNVGMGLRLYNGRFVLSVDGENIFDEDVQQHVFGDIIGRKISSRVTYHF